MQHSEHMKLPNIKLWYAWAFVALVAIFVVIEIFAFYTMFIPDLLYSMKGSAAKEVIASVESGMHKIMLHLSVWIYSSLIVNVALIYSLWKIKRSIVANQKSEDGAG